VEVQALGTRLNRDLVLIAESDLNDPGLVSSREGWRVRPHGPVERRLPPRGARGDHRGTAGFTTATSARSGPWSRRSPGCSSTTGTTHRSAAVATAGRWTCSASPVSASSVTCRITTRSVTGRPGTGSPAGCPPTWSRWAPGWCWPRRSPPMLFMGEEWAASTPWQYFTDHNRPPGWPRRSPRAAGRSSARTAGEPAEVPNPQDEQTFLRSKLDWAERDTPRHQEILAWYRELIALRRAWPETDRSAAGPGAGRPRRGAALAGAAPRAAADSRPAWVSSRCCFPLGARGSAVLAASSFRGRARRGAAQHCRRRRSRSWPPKTRRLEPATGVLAA